VLGDLSVQKLDAAGQGSAAMPRSRCCGAAPIPASSGRIVRHRLNRGGDRQGNNALWTIAVCRMSYDPRTIAYVQRRTKEGKSKLEIIRCLMRYIAREVHRDLQAALVT
jgi:transposase